MAADKFTILFAPDPLSIRDGKQKAGFTEAEALEQLAHATKNLKADVQLVVKCHPLQPLDVFSGVIQRSPVKIHLLAEADPLELLHASDVVIGFYSNMLLEAEAIGKKVIRFFPGNESADLLRHKTSLPVIKDEENLLAALKHCINE
jgi:CDP-glycerol glycerophosphotransferase (TagB/SpsB family)